MRIHYCICVKHLCSSKELPHVWPEKDLMMSKSTNALKLRLLSLCIVSSENIKQLWRYNITSISFWISITCRYRYCSEYHCRSRRLLLLSGDYFIMEIIISITSSLHFNCSVLLGCMQTLNESCSCFCIKESCCKEGCLHARLLCIPVIHRLNSKS